MGLIVGTASAGAARREPLGLPCDEIGALVSRVALAVVCDAERARSITEALLARFRSLPSAAPVDDSARVFVARAAYEAAMTALAEDGGPGPDSGTPAAEHDAHADGARLAVLSTLEPRARAIVVLRDVEGLELAQISGVVRSDEGVVATELFRARRALGRSIGSATDPITG